MNNEKLIKLPKQVEEITSQLETNVQEVVTLKTNKVDKVVGKGLSTNDYDNTEKSKVALIDVKADKSYVDTQITNIQRPILNYSGTFAQLQADGTVDKTKNYIILNDTDTTNYGKACYWNGTTWVSGWVVQATGIADNSIGVEKTNFTQTITNNLFNAKTINVGKYVIIVAGDTFGQLGDATISWASDYLAVKNNQTYNFTKPTGNYNLVGYDENKLPLVQITCEDRTTYLSFTLNQASRIRFVRLSTRYEYCQPELFYLGQAKPNEYAKNYVLNNDFFIAPNITITSSDITIKYPCLDRTNLFDSATVTIGKVIDTSTNSIIDNAGGYVSDFITVKEDYIYCVNYIYNCKVALYDKDKLLMSTTNYYDDHFYTPVGCCFVKISQLTTSIKPIDFKVYEGVKEKISCLKESKRLLLEKIDGFNTYNVKWFAKESSDTSDSERIQRAIDLARYGTVVIPNGNFYIDKKLLIHNFASIKMSENTKLIATAQMDCVIEYNGTPWNRTLIVRDENLNQIEPTNASIIGGFIEASGLSDCLRINNYKHFTLRDITLLNGKTHGCIFGLVGHGYEAIVNNVYIKTTMMGLSGNIGLKTVEGDSHFTDVIVVDYTVGIEVYGASNRLTRCHCWGGIVQGSLDNSINFKIGGGENVLFNCYADTAKIGFQIKSVTRLIGCTAFNNYSRFKLDNVVYINNPNGNVMRVSNCYFSKTAPNTTLYTGVYNASMQIFDELNTYNGLALPTQ